MPVLVFDVIRGMEKLIYRRVSKQMVISQVPMTCPFGVMHAVVAPKLYSLDHPVVQKNVYFRGFWYTFFWNGLIFI